LIHFYKSKMSDELNEANVKNLRDIYEKNGQGHVFTFWQKLTDEEKIKLIQDLKDVDVSEMSDMWNQTKNGNNLLNTEGMVPIEESLTGSVKASSKETLAEYEETALRSMSEGQVGVLLLAGGQGTRLGVKYPKGMYDIGLKSGKTLYQIQVERILRLEELAERLTGKAGKICMYIMTSEHTRAPTQEFFIKNKYFGASSTQIIIFEQRTIPAFDHQGKFLMSSRTGLARSPGGNGGLYSALRDEKILEDLEKKDIRYLHVYCVDNVLVKVADPRFIGFCIQRGAEAGNKVVEKVLPEEAVGVVVKIDNKVQVVEYSEMSNENCSMREKDGSLTFRAGNICNHFFTRQFLQVCVDHERELAVHLANKKVPFVDLQTGELVKPETNNGIKMEKFVFDVFQFSKSFVVWECLREDEFSPLKNAEGSAKDNPTTARQDLLSLHRRYLVSAGSIIQKTAQDLVEICPLVSYAGEGLEKFRDQELSAPTHIC